MTFFHLERTNRLGFVLGAVLVVLAHSLAPAWAESSAPVAPQADQTAQRADPAQVSPGRDEAEPPAPKAAEPEPRTTGESRGDLAGMTLELPARVVAMTSSKAEWANAFAAITAAIAKVDGAIEAAGLARGGRPFAVFLATDEETFQFEAMIPLAGKPDGKAKLTDEVKIGASPQGKAIKFLHRGAYDDIESTYDLITALLDEKGLEAQNLFIEEYLTDTKEADDVGLEADIYVFIK